MEFNFKPLATIKNSRLVPTDDFWGGIVSEIELADHIPTEAFDCISDFSHLEIINRIDENSLFLQLIQL